MTKKKKRRQWQSSIRKECRLLLRPRVRKRLDPYRLPRNVLQLHPNEDEKEFAEDEAREEKHNESDAAKEVDDDANEANADSESSPKQSPTKRKIAHSQDSIQGFQAEYYCYW